MEIRIYDMDSFLKGDYSKCELVTTTDKTIEFGGFITVAGRNYRMCTFDPNLNVLGVEEVEMNENPETVEYEPEFRCPYCGEIDDDAWELGDDGETECGSCGSQLEFERTTTIEYTVHPIKSAPVITL